MAKKGEDVDISELAAYEEDEEDVQGGNDKKADDGKKCVALCVCSSAAELTVCFFRDTHIAIQSTGFREFLLKPELLRAIADCGFEHPSEGMFLFASSGDPAVFFSPAQKKLHLFSALLAPGLGPCPSFSCI